MTTSNIRWSQLIGGVVLLLIGLLWTLQGAGIIGGSAMSGLLRWLIIGGVLMVVGLGLAVTALRGPSR